MNIVINIFMVISVMILSIEKVYAHDIIIIDIAFGSLTPYIIPILIVLIIIVIFIYYFNKLKNRETEFEKERLQKEIEIKEKELIIMVMSLIKTNSIVHTLVKDMKAVQKELTSTDKSKLTPIIRELSANEDANLWDEIEVRFMDVHPVFYDVLRTKYSYLTPAEIKVCMFLRLKLSSKEIAELLHKSPASIEVDRARIRKKLNLTNTNINLVTFINNI